MQAQVSVEPHTVAENGSKHVSSCPGRVCFGDITGALFSVDDGASRFSRLFTEYRQRVFRTALAIVRRADIADDVTQQVFAEVWRHYDRYDPARPFWPWVSRITVHRSLDALRRQHNREAPVEELEQLTAPGSPHTEAVRGEVAAALMAALAQLNEIHRVAIVMRFYHGMTEAEMASRLGCPPGTVKTRLHNGLRNLRSVLVPGTEDEPKKTIRDARSTLGDWLSDVD